MIEKFEEFLSSKSKREKSLFALLLFVFMFYILHSAFLDSLHNITNLQSTLTPLNLQSNTNLKQLYAQEQQLNTKLTALASTLQSQPPSSSNLLKTISELITKHSLTLIHSSIQKLPELYTLQIETEGEFEDMINFTNSTLSLPLISITSFSINQNLKLSLTLTPKSLSPPSSPPSNEIILQTLQSQISSPLTLSFDNPFSSEPTPILLEAIINQKAKINGIWLSQGQKILGHLIKSISSNSITLEKQGEIQILYLNTRKVFQ